MSPKKKQLKKKPAKKNGKKRYGKPNLVKHGVLSIVEGD